MLRCRTALPIVLVLLSAHTATAQPKDRLGDPLPVGALARIGTTRLTLDREIQAIAVAPDGKRIAAVSDSMLGVWDVAGGKQVLNLPWLHTESQNGWPPVIGFTADGKAVACQAPKQSWLGLLDIATGKMGLMLGKPFDRWLFARDGRVALRAEPADMSVGYTIESLDLPSGRPRQRWTFEYDPAFVQAMMPHGVRFHLSGDGKLLAAHEVLDGKRQQLVRVFAAATGVEIGRWPLGWPLLRGLAFSADGKLLACTAGTSETTARVWEIATGKELTRWTHKGGINTGRAALAFAPDGAWLFSTDATGIVRWDWRNGKRLQDYPDAGGPIAFVNGGKAIAVQGPIGAIRLLDIASGKDMLALPRVGAHVAITPDSRHIAWSEGGAVVLADSSGNEVRRWPAHEHFVGPLAFAPDGKTLASAGTDLRIRLWDIPEGRERRTLIRTGVQRLFFSPDSRRLVTSGSLDLCLWDVASGRRLGWWYGRGEPPVMAPGVDVVAVPDRPGQRLRLLEPADGRELHTLGGYQAAISFALALPQGAVIEPWYAPLPPTFSPDGRLLLTGADRREETGLHAIQVWEVAAGRRMPARLDGATIMLNQVAFTPDSRLVAAMRSDGRLCLVDARNGATVRLLGIGAAPLITAPLFTPDGRTLVTAIKDRIHIWEFASGGEIVCRSGHQDVVRELTISADGRLLASGSADRTILIWDLAHLGPGGAAPVDALWTDLASADAPRARRAVEALSAAPAQATVLLEKRLPVAAPDAKQLGHWIAALGSDDFDERREAERALEGAGELAGPVLRKALAGKPAPEARRRIENLLNKLDGPTLSATQLRAVRGVQVLEALASAEARRLLAALAKGPAEARVTSEARAALARLDKQ